MFKILVINITIIVCSAMSSSNLMEPWSVCCFSQGYSSPCRLSSIQYRTLSSLLGWLGCLQHYTLRSEPLKRLKHFVTMAQSEYE